MRSSLRLAIPGLAAAALLATLLAGRAFAQSATSVQASCPVSSPYGYSSAPYGYSAPYGSPGAYGYAYQTGQTGCQVTNEGQPLYTGSVVFVASAAANGASPSECDGVTAPDYTTQNFGNAPLSLNTWFSGPAGCAFTVTSGTVQVGDQLGTEQLAPGSVPPGGGTISLNALVCSDPSCGGLNSGALSAGCTTYQPSYGSYYGPSYTTYQPSCSYPPVTPSYTYAPPPPPTPSYSYAPPPPPPPTVVVTPSNNGCSDPDCDGGYHHHHHHHHDDS